VTIRVLAVTKRIGATSERGWSYAVRYVEEGESGEEMEWLDEFLDQHCEGVEVGE